MSLPYRTALLVGALALPGISAAQARDADTQSELALLRQTVERLSARVQVLEAERAAAPAPAVAAASPAPLGAPTTAAAPVPVLANITVFKTVSPLPVRESFDEDELAVARADNEVAPGDSQEGFFQLPGTRTWLRLGGYAKLDAMYDSGDAGDSDQFITSEIPVDGGRDGSRFNMHARQTRLTLEGRRETDRGQLRFLVQNDFFGSGGTYGYRLRHAYGQLGNTYAGFGWSAFMDLDSGPDTLDFAGVPASPSARVASIRQYFPLGRGNQIVLAAEHRSPEIQFNDPAQAARTAAPNLVLAARHEADWGSVQLAGVLRYLAYDSARDSGAGDDSATAGGLAFSGAYGGTDSGNYVVFGVVAGQGIAAYLGDLGGLNLDGFVDADGSLQTLKQQGGWLGYTHHWTGDVRSTLTWSRLYVEREGLLDPSVFRRSEYAAANVIWQPSPSWSWGAELLYGNLQDQDDRKGDVWRLQTAFKYDFVR